MCRTSSIDSDDSIYSVPRETGNDSVGKHALYADLSQNVQFDMLCNEAALSSLWIRLLILWISHLNILIGYVTMCIAEIKHEVFSRPKSRHAFL